MGISSISSQETYDLRQRVLRPGLPLEACVFPQDSMSLHLGFRSEGAVVSVLSAHEERSELFPESKQWRIRGMATEPDRQGQGLGAELLRELSARARAEGVERIWCNARLIAIPFYARAGYALNSPEFHIEGVGPHRVMSLKL